MTDTKRNLQKKIEALEAAKKSLASEEASNQMSMEQLQKSFDAIDSTINQINAKMRKRGLKDIAPKIKNVGGPVEEDVDIEELTKFYKKN